MTADCPQFVQVSGMMAHQLYKLAHIHKLRACFIMFWDKINLPLQILISDL